MGHINHMIDNLCCNKKYKIILRSCCWKTSFKFTFEIKSTSWDDFITNSSVGDKFYLVTVVWQICRFSWKGFYSSKSFNQRNIHRCPSTFLKMKVFKKVNAENQFIILLQERWGAFSCGIKLHSRRWKVNNFNYLSDSYSYDCGGGEKIVRT